jgi:hypothetical protein
VIQHPILVEEDAVAGPSDVQRAVSGGEDPTELSEYEKLRERNMRERDGKERKKMTQRRKDLSNSHVRSG